MPTLDEGEPIKLIVISQIQQIKLRASWGVAARWHANRARDRGDGGGRQAGGH